MIIDLDLYKINREYVQKWYRDHKNYGIPNAIPILSSVPPFVPCIVIAFYIAEDIGFNEELIKKIDMYINFYRYTRILNQKEGSPYLTFGNGDDIK